MMETGDLVQACIQWSSLMTASTAGISNYTGVITTVCVAIQYMLYVGWTRTVP